MEKHGVEAVPYNTPEIDTWRHNFTGVQHHHKPTNFLVFGAVDDVWVDSEGKLNVVDYKATGAKEHHVYDSYRRQMEIYQWLLKQNNHDVSPKGYFVFARVNKGSGFGEGKAVLPFDLFIESIEGDNSWVESALESAREAFDKDESPRASPNCEYCAYRGAASQLEL